MYRFSKYQYGTNEEKTCQTFSFIYHLWSERQLLCQRHCFLSTWIVSQHSNYATWLALALSCHWCIPVNCLTSCPSSGSAPLAFICWHIKLFHTSSCQRYMSWCTLVDHRPLHFSLVNISLYHPMRFHRWCALLGPYHCPAVNHYNFGEILFPSASVGCFLIHGDGELRNILIQDRDYGGT